MLSHRFVLLFLVFGTCSWCSQLEEEIVAPTAFARELQDSLAQVREDYEKLALFAALGRVRRLRGCMETTHEVLPPELRAEVYQYLAMLHFDRGVYRDSIGYYAGRASELVQSHSPLHLRARQQLCLALSRYHDWRWVEMDLAAALGLRLLEQEQEQHGALYAGLQHAQGIARKMYAHSTLNIQLQRTRLREAAVILQEAILTYRRHTLPRFALAYEDLGIVYSQMPEHQQQVPDLLDSIARDAVVDRTAVDPHRLLGYWHWRAGRADSTRYHYERLLAYPAIFRYDYVSEAQSVLRESQRNTADFAAALATNVRVLREAGCCPPEVTVDHPGQLPTCTLHAGCIYDLADQADTYYQRYRSGRDTADLELAYQLALSALGDYDKALRSLTEEAVYNRLIELGERLITVALEVTHAKLTAKNDDACRDALFRTMEFGNSYLLNRELVQLAQLSHSPELLPLRDSLAATIRELIILKRNYTVHRTAGLAELRYADHLMRRRDTLLRHLQPKFENAFAGQQETGEPLALARVQSALSPEQALISFAETDGRMLAMYIDRDTAHCYAVDTSVFRSIRLVERAVVRMQPFSDALRDSSARVANRLLGPVAALLKARKDLLLIPSLSLSSFPFAVLPVPQLDSQVYDTPLPYLIQGHSLRYLDSWQTERWHQTRRTSLLAHGLPRVGVWTHPELKGYLGPLGDQLVAHGAADSEHYTLTDCSSEQLLARGGNYDWLHLSVHARGSTVQLDDNYLYLNQGDSLNGAQLGSQPMATRLVVLAACSTARGVSSRREGTYSIRRSFHRAGVPDVVSSLFDVPAVATAGILQEFYRGLWRGLPPERALAAAQRACLTGRLDVRWVVPGYWAGLVVG